MEDSRKALEIESAYEEVEPWWLRDPYATEANAWSEYDQDWYEWLESSGLFDYAYMDWDEMMRLYGDIYDGPPYWEDEIEQEREEQELLNAYIEAGKGSMVAIALMLEHDQEHR